MVIIDNKNPDIYKTLNLYIYMRGIQICNKNNFSRKKTILIYIKKNLVKKMLKIKSGIKKGMKFKIFSNL